MRSIPLLFENIFRRLLREDIEYRLLTVNEKRGFSKFTKKWAIKRLIKRKIEVIPFFKKWIHIIYFKYHKLSFFHCMRLAHNIYIKRELCISFQSGFGDMLQAYPYFRVAKLMFPNLKLVAVIHSPEKCIHSEMRHCKSATLLDGEGLKIDYVYEFLETNPFIDEIRYDDCWADGYLYAFPAVLTHEFKDSFNRESFEKNIPFLFNDSDKLIGDQYLIDSGLYGATFIVVHFKTSVDHLVYFISKICEDWFKRGFKLKFLLLGNIPQGVCQTIQNFQHTYVDLSNSYIKGITTRQLLYIASKGKLFLGGRGGFNAIFYLFGIPTINIFDEQGSQEMASGLWPRRLWEENYFDIISYEEQSPIEVYEKIFRDKLEKLLG